MNKQEEAYRKLLQMCKEPKKAKELPRCFRQSELSYARYYWELTYYFPFKFILLKVHFDQPQSKPTLLLKFEIRI